MAESNIIQMHDYAGNNQYPVTLASLVYDEDGETVGKKLALLLDWFEWGDDAHSSVKTKYHFWSEKQLSAGGIGEEGEGGEGGIGTITGIYVNGVPYNEPDEFGMLTLPNYPTSLEWDSINGKPTHLSQFTDDVVAGNYLPLSGGIIGDSWSGGTEIRRKNSNNGYASLIFSQADGTILGRFGFSGVDRPIFVTQSGAYNPLLHSGNVGDYSVKRTDAIDLSQTNLSAVGYGTTTSGWLIYGPAIAIGHPNGYTMLLQQRTDDNIIYVNRKNPNGIAGDWKAIAFTDSDITGNAATATNADQLDGKHLTDIMNIGFDNTLDLDTLYSERALIARYWVFANSSNISNQPWSNSAAQVWTLPGNYNLQIAKFYNSNDIRLRGRSGEGWTNWQQLAFTDSTVEAAKRIVNDNGDFVIYRSGSGNIIVGDNNGAGDTHLLGNNIYLRYGGSAATYGLILNSYGNVTIGSSDLAGTDAKLYVDGSVYVGNKKVLERVSNNLHIGEGIRGAYDTNIFGTNILFNTASGYRAMIIATGGNVGIGTEYPDEMLHVAGNIRLKNASNYGCYLKFGDGEYCHLYEDSDDHLKIYAGYGILLSTDVGYGVTIDKSLTIGSAVLSWDYTNNALKIEGNVYTTGQLSAGGVGTEVQKVFDIAAVSDAYTANQPHTATLTHNLNTYDLAVVVYEVEEISQSDGTTTEKLTQVLADVTLTDENNVTVYFASRKINRKYRIVIIG